jgi:hypothetical protein
MSMLTNILVLTGEDQHALGLLVGRLLVTAADASLFAPITGVILSGSNSRCFQS